MSKPVILLLGKLPPPYMGPSIATEIILKSTLNNYFQLVHLDTKAYDDLKELGKFSFKKIVRNYSIYLKMFSLLKKHKPQLVWIPISQTTAGFFKDSMFIWIARLYGKKVILHLRGSDFKRWLLQASFITKKYVSVTLKSCSGIIVLGNKLRQLFKDYFKPENIYVCPNGADYLIPEKKIKNSEVINILYLANLQPSKGIEDVMEAVALLNETYQNKFRLDIIGGWRKEETKKFCLELIEKNNLPVTIYPPEVSKDKFTFLINADIFVFTPREPEGHPWVIVEAMAAGLPIISTDQGAITESVIHEHNGFIVEPKQPWQIADCIKKLMENPDLRKRMSENSRIQYLEGFTEQKMVERFVNTFEHLLQH